MCVKEITPRVCPLKYKLYKPTYACVGGVGLDIDSCIILWYKYDIIVITHVQGEARMRVNNNDIIQVNMIQSFDDTLRNFTNFLHISKQTVATLTIRITQFCIPVN